MIVNIQIIYHEDQSQVAWRSPGASSIHPIPCTNHIDPTVARSRMVSKPLAYTIIFRTVVCQHHRMHLPFDSHMLEVQCSQDELKKLTTLHLVASP
jgi:hypothetical protein